MHETLTLITIDRARKTPGANASNKKHAACLMCNKENLVVFLDYVHLKAMLDVTGLKYAKKDMAQVMNK